MNYCELPQKKSGSEIRSVHEPGYNYCRCAGSSSFLVFRLNPFGVIVFTRDPWHPGQL